MKKRKLNLQTEIEDLLSMLSEEEFPELYECLADAAEERSVDAYELAADLLECDRSADLPPVIREFAEQLLSSAIADGNDDAMNDLGALYYAGERGFEQDFGKAVLLYQMAAEHGNTLAQENLGYCYYYGRNMPVDYEKAYHYFALGAFAGRPVSLYKIGDMYAAGLFVKKNEKEAFALYEHCLDIMTEEEAPSVAGPVYLRLGKMFLHGIGTEKDLRKAMVCYQKAEVFLYDMVKDGESMYRKSLQAAVDGQTETRAQLAKELTVKPWLNGDED